jgi:hypothetical protein
MENAEDGAEPAKNRLEILPKPAVRLVDDRYCDTVIGKCIKQNI